MSLFVFTCISLMKTKVTRTGFIIAKVLIGKYYAKRVHYNSYRQYCN